MARWWRKKKYHLVNWNKVCHTKKNGGLGIKNLEALNISLLCKWWWKIENESSLWQKIIVKKYFHGKDLYNIKVRNSDSPVWKDLMKIRAFYLKGRQITTKCGDKSRFWLDSWVNERPLCTIDPELYEICDDKFILVKDARIKNWQLSFRRWLNNENEIRWISICGDCENFEFQDSPDTVQWKWGGKKTFTVKSMYNSLSNNISGLGKKHIWKSKVPPKIKIFMWFLENNRLLTKDNLIRRKWSGDPSCCFCPHAENIEHLFFTCPIARVIWGTVAKCLDTHHIPNNVESCYRWLRKHLNCDNAVHVILISAICWAIWKARNKMCFDHVLVNSPNEIICHAGALVSSWAGLSKKELQDLLQEGAKMLVRAASARGNRILGSGDEMEGMLQPHGR